MNKIKNEKKPVVFRNACLGIVKQVEGVNTMKLRMWFPL